MAIQVDLLGSGDLASTLRDGLASRTSTVGLIGLGYVGLPLLVAASKAGFPVLGFDVDREKIASLQAGQSHVVDVSSTDLPALKSTRFTSEARALKRAEVLVITVPTPLGNGVPDLSHVKQAAIEAARALRPGKLVILESTSYPGTTEEVVLPLLESVSGLTAGTDFFLSYSPERIDPGSDWVVTGIPKLVAGVGEADAELAELFYQQLGCRVVRAPSLRVAEMAKLVENTFRQVNIALVNEMATVARELDVDIWAAIEAASTKPFGYMPFWPGPGVGGHCIAVDPTYLSWRVRERLGVGIGFVEHANDVNRRMPAYVAARIGEALNDVGKPVKGSRILAIGLSYKSGVNDVRESPAVQVVEHLAHSGAICSYHDPYVPSASLGGQPFESQTLDPETLARQDCVAILTGHPDIDYGALIAGSPLVFDSRGVTRGIEAPNLVRL